VKDDDDDDDGWYGMEMNVEKTEIMRMSSPEFALQFMMNQKHPENVEYF
jgi:hypothetical protein